MKRRNLLGLFALCLLVGLATACSDSGSEEELGPCGTRTACMQPIDCGGDGMAEFVCASDGCCYNFADMCALAEYKDHPKCQAVDGDTEQEDTSCPADRTCCTDADCETGWTCNVDQDICECPEQYETDAEGITRCCSNNHCPAPNPNDPEDPGFVCYPEEHKCVPECKINTAQDHQCCTRGDGFSPQCPPEGNSALTECKDGFCVEPGEDAPPGWECVSDNDCNSPENCVQQFYGCVWNDGTAKDKKVCQLKTPCEAGKQACCNEAVGACTPGCYELGDYLEDTGILTCNADGKNYMLSRCSSEYEAWPSNAPVASDLYDCMNMTTSIACLYAGRCTIIDNYNPADPPQKNMSQECGWDNPYKLCMEKTTQEYTGKVCSLRTVGENMPCIDADGVWMADCDVGLGCYGDESGGTCIVPPEEKR